MTARCGGCQLSATCARTISAYPQRSILIALSDDRRHAGWPEDPLICRSLEGSSFCSSLRVALYLPALSRAPRTIDCTLASARWYESAESVRIARPGVGLAARFMVTSGLYTLFAP
jgi:hypothetical protein